MSEPQFEITDYDTLASGRNIVIPLDESKTGFAAHLVLPHSGSRAWITPEGGRIHNVEFITETQIRRMAAALNDYVRYLDERAARP